MSTSANCKPSISSRVSIAWPPASAYEDSSVLVLSSPPSTSPPSTLLYVDVRLSLPLSRSSKILWAFAGLRHTLQTESGKKHRWDHVVDSRRAAGLAGADTLDEGVTVRRMEVDADGGEVEVEVEVGEGWNPDTATVQRYEEIWSDEPVLSTSPYVFLTLGTSPTESTGFIALVGSHTLGMSAESDGHPFQVVRLFEPPDSTSGASEPTRYNDGWEVVFSTPEPEENDVDTPVNLTSEMLALVELLAASKSESQSLGWNKGDTVSLCSDLATIGQARKWTVFDWGNI
ncbi:hypothetical protein BOTBODRAFT_39944 [Botryobasidium botryosum FD-172 SS1]|uniref:Protein HRI1 n=1 Tax=Botryobasidium botryosum (strain FD-172 SS1) TaxID=930990 RepID=A0A067M1X1_BOTB1|nr:hypothetical protein BOTBODRAFT_39944 [Botryobasidium botryosum FD-172 SS1]